MKQVVALLGIAWALQVSASPDAGEPDAGALDDIEEFTPAPSAPPVESFAPPEPAQTTARVFGFARGLFGLDAKFDPAPRDAYPENVADLRARAHLGVDVKLSERARVLVEGRALWRGTAAAGFGRAKATIEPSLGEAFVDLYSKYIDLRAGSQLLTFGANPAFSPADALNPRDLRESLLQGEPEDAKLPVLAVRAQGEVGVLGWQVAYVPFFAPHRFTVFGQDESLLQPGWGVALPQVIDPSIEDELQPHLLETERPSGGDLALRATCSIGKLKLGATWLWMAEKVPRMTFDPELQALLDAAARGAQPDPAVQLSVANRLRAGERLYTSRYIHHSVLAVDASRIVGPAQLDFDASVTGQTFYTDAFEPVRKTTLSWVLGVTQAEDSPWLYNVSYVGMAVLGIEAQELIAILEPGTARGVARTAFLHLLIATVSRKLLGDKVEVGGRLAFEPVQRSWAFGPRVTWRPWERVSFLLAAEISEGPRFSPFGYFGRNDQLLAGVQADFF